MYTSANPDVQDEHMTYYAAFDIETPFNMRHRDTIKIRSLERQTVYISVYTYDSQHIRNGECDNYSEQSELVWKHEKMEYY